MLGIMINQWRQKIGVMYGDPRTTPGGVGKNYAYFVRAEVRRGDWIEVGTGKDKTRIGQTIGLPEITGVLPSGPWSVSISSRNLSAISPSFTEPRGET